MSNTYVVTFFSEIPSARTSRVESFKASDDDEAIIAAGGIVVSGGGKVGYIYVTEEVSDGPPTLTLVGKVGPHAE